MNFFTRVRGTRIFLPPLSLVREEVIETIIDVYQEFGFEPWDLPALLPASVLLAKGGQEIREEIYLFRDKGNREIGLRFDLTLPSAAVVASNPQLSLPMKRYAVGKVWRYDRPQAGRFREFLQADVDIFGARDSLADAECVAAVHEALKQLGIDAEVRVNNIGKVREILIKLGLKGEKLARFLRAIDKWYKIGEEGVRKELGELEDFLERYLERRGKLEESVLEVGESLDAFGVPWKFDPFIVRGLDYYTGPVFEVVGERGLTIAAGGRYDGLVKLLGGRDIPATGMSIGVDRLVDLYFRDRIPKRRGVFVAVLKGMEKYAIEVSKMLRRAGINVYMDVSGRKLSNQLSFAEKQGYSIVVIPGKEFEGGKVVLKYMQERRQREVGLSELADEILQHLSRI